MLKGFLNDIGENNMTYDTVELNRKYWNDIINMGKFYNIDPWKLVKIDRKDKKVTCYNHPEFEKWIKTGYSIEFALTVIENKPVFKDDILYRNDGIQVKIVEWLKGFNDLITCRIFDEPNIEVFLTVRDLSWNRPQKLPEKVQFIKDETIIMIQILNHYEENLKYDYGINDITRIKNKLKDSIKD